MKHLPIPCTWAGSLLMLVLAAFFVPSAPAQSPDNVAAANLAAAKQLSAASGRPIFAIAGRST